MGCLSTVGVPPAPVGSLDTLRGVPLDSLATKDGKAMPECAPWDRRKRMEKFPEQLHRMAVNTRHFCFLLPAKFSSGRAVLLAGAWPCLARTDTHLAMRNPEEVIRSRCLCLVRSKQILYFWELSLRWSEYWSCGCWHTSSTNREKSVRTILIKDSNGSQKHVDDFFHVLMPLATSGIKRGEYQ